jgi:hypothetical protein
VTPVAHNVELLDNVSIEQVMAEAGKKARDGKLTAEEMAGVTCDYLFLDSCEAVQSLVKPSRTCNFIKTQRKMHLRSEDRRGAQGCFRVKLGS